MTPSAGPILTPGLFCRGPLNNVSCQISKLWILWTTLKELYAMNIHTKFYQIWQSGLGGEVILMKKFMDGQIDDRHHSMTTAHHEHYVLRWAKNTSGFFLCSQLYFILKKSFKLWHTVKFKLTREACRFVL